MEVDANSNNNFDDSLYNELLLKENIEVPPHKFNSKINIFLEDSLKDKIEEKCISEGYIKKDSINILKKSLGLLKGSRFNGDINYVLLYKALVCSPKIGTIIKCNVKLVNNKLGILGNNGPLTIIVGRQFHNNPALLDDINIGDNIEIKIIDSKYSLNDKEIKIIGKLNTDSDNISKNNVDVDDLNQIDTEDIDDNTINTSKNNIDDIDLESLDDIDTDDDIMDDTEMEDDEMDDGEMDDGEMDDVGMEDAEINDDEIEENNIDEDEDNYS
jgi:DNA-directed RNA polymerase subunit E'/Rpb7